MKFPLSKILALYLLSRTGTDAAAYTTCCDSSLIAAKILPEHAVT